jgi:hypothetical protein
MRRDTSAGFMRSRTFRAQVAHPFSRCATTNRLSSRVAVPATNRLRVSSEGCSMNILLAALKGFIHSEYE